MGFTAADLDIFLDAFEAREVAIKLSGATVKTIRGIWRRKTEFVGQGEQIVILPSLLCKDSDLADVTRNHTLTVGGVEYKIYGDFVPENSGLSRIGLTKR